LALGERRELEREQLGFFWYGWSWPDPAEVMAVVTLERSSPSSSLVPSGVGGVIGEAAASGGVLSRLEDWFLCPKAGQDRKPF
jgi:hypothetical protein